MVTLFKAIGALKASEAEPTACTIGSQLLPTRFILPLDGLCLGILLLKDW